MDKVSSIQERIVQKTQFEAFFATYQMLSDRYDKSVLDLYDENAVISTSRIMADGSTRSMSFSSDQFKALALSSWEAGKKANDRSVFSDVEIKLSENKARITANRYSLSKCYNDEGYCMVVYKNDSGELRILEEHTASPQLSNCPDQANLIATIEAYAAYFNKQVPIDIDEESRLVQVTASGTMWFINMN
ncbi:hypothetical protein [Endozoicomonas elysicola]|uniref:hypothetical protein n=1 Tax=Endozoicomonas elysicola TaxID=305900 RepID=UPI0003698E0D|nr:hypothetical protein [Endozoicomonas elysicola]